jgi:hypothetical protein
MANYSDIFNRVKARYNIRVRRWRSNMSGAAWRVHYDDGRTINWIECPRLRSPLSVAIFLHEVGHHVIGFDRYELSCEEEWHAWRWAIRTMRELGVNPTPRTLRRVERSMQYAVDKAIRRGFIDLPSTLQSYQLRAA